MSVCDQPMGGTPRGVVWKSKCQQPELRESNWLGVVGVDRVDAALEVADRLGRERLCRESGLRSVAGRANGSEDRNNRSENELGKGDGLGLGGGY